MRKSVKLLLIIVGLAGVMLCLNSCQSLDDMRKSRMDWSDKKHTAIEFKDSKYNKLPDSEYFSVDFGEYGKYFIADKDVPLLLAEDIYGTSTALSKDENIISAHGNYYAKEDKYDYYLGIIKNSDMDRFYVNAEKFDKDGNYYTERVVLDEDICDIIEKAIEGKKPSVLPYDDEYICGDIGKCDSTGLMKGEWNTLYCHLKTEKVYLYDGSYYELPDECYETAKKLIEDYSRDYYYGNYNYDYEDEVVYD